MPCRSSAATATRANSRSSASCATPRSCRSTRAPTRSSGWSSPASCSMADALSALDVAALLRATGAQLAAELGALPEAVLRYHPVAGEWCAKEVLGHLIEAERRGFAGRIKTLLAEARPRFVGWDQTDVARERRDCDRDARELLVEFGALRDESADLVAGLHASDLARAGDHPKVGVLTV